MKPILEPLASWAENDLEFISTCCLPGIRFIWITNRVLNSSPVRQTHSDCPFLNDIHQLSALPMGHSLYSFFFSYYSVLMVATNYISDTKRWHRVQGQRSTNNFWIASGNLFNIFLHPAQSKFMIFSQQIGHCSRRKKLFLNSKASSSQRSVGFPSYCWNSQRINILCDNIALDVQFPQHCYSSGMPSVMLLNIGVCGPLFASEGPRSWNKREI